MTGKSFNPLLEAPDEVKKMNGGKSELFMQVGCGRGGGVWLLHCRCRCCRLGGGLYCQRACAEEHVDCCRVLSLPLPHRLQVRGSKFVKYQECKIQESPDEVPQGSTPRTLMVHLRGSLTRSLKAGDNVTLSGIFLPEPYTGQVRVERLLLGAAAVCGQLLPCLMGGWLDTLPTVD